MAKPNGRALVKANKTHAQLFQEFTEKLLADFKQHGTAAINTVRMEFPATYLRLVAALRSGIHETNQFEELTDDRLAYYLSNLQRFADAAAGADTGTDPPPGDQPSAGVPAISQAD